MGIAVTSSALLRSAGITSRPAIIYDRIMAGPALAKAIPGRTNSPELIMAPEAIAKTSKRPSSFFNAIPSTLCSGANLPELRHLLRSAKSDQCVTWPYDAIRTWIECQFIQCRRLQCGNDDSDLLRYFYFPQHLTGDG